MRRHKEREMTLAGVLGRAFNEYSLDGERGKLKRRMNIAKINFKELM